MDPLVIDTVGAAVVAGSVAAAGAVARACSVTPRRPAVPLRRLIDQLPRRSRRLARDIVALARECSERHPAGSSEAFTAQETLRAYLPETIAAYLAVPASIRSEKRRGEGGPRDELERQLLTLFAALNDIREADARHAYARMSANGAFFEQRFADTPRARLDADDDRIAVYARLAANGARQAVRIIEAAVERRRNPRR